MKKKIKDLTKEEFDKICDNNICTSCKLDTNYLWCKIDNLENYGDEEIEVEDDE